MKKFITILSIIMFLLIYLTSCNSSAKDTFDINNSFKDEKVLKIHFIDVGQGDATLIELHGYNILIDAGPNSSARNLISYLKEINIKSIDYIIATHPDEDHIGGMDEVLRNFKVKILYAPKVIKNTEAFNSMIKELKNKNLKINVPYKDMKLDLGEESNLTFLTPIEYGGDNDNNLSLVAKINFKEISAIFMADCETEVERQLLKDSHTLEANIIKLGHHGSKSSTSTAFLKKVDPDYAIISCGKNNKYGHPHKETIDKLDNLNIKYFRTDIDGNITIRSDGFNIVKD
ncbi:ComEC family competence protein [Clostridium sp. N3C]|uniref:ComEC/Rec2 family competence protein n=1 Tax=Clostridium sp. N3C TaxID=1776758 RepID=UPI00092E1468|nr:ComEC/Rec2 family competence protein [Clostridium sp. N3C]SCN22307.1 ComEC family competence protein [Clostridium sp. N3C]